MYDRIKVELRGAQWDLQTIRVVSTAPLPLGEPKLRDELAQLCQLADVIEAHLHRAQEETEQAT